MAKKDKPAKKPVRRRRQNQGSGGAIGILFVLLLTVIVVINREAAMLIVIGLIPTLVLGITGKGDFKAERMQSVALANMSGVLLLLASVWSKSNGFEELISNPTNWIIMWGSAAIGYALNFVGPMIAVMILQNMVKERLKAMQQQRQELIDLWGPEVLGEKQEKPQQKFISPRQ